MKKKDLTQKFSVVRKPITLDVEDVRISPAEVYHRMLSHCQYQNIYEHRLRWAIANCPSDPSLFSYEMTAVAPEHVQR